MAWVTSSSSLSGFSRECAKVRQAARSRALLLGTLLLTPVAALGEEVYLTPRAFVEQAFHPAQGRPETLWLDRAVQGRARAILGHAYPGTRIAYHGQAHTTAWILEGIGKERPITLGILVRDDRVVQVRILIYRESRGWEVRLPAFTRQFEGTTLHGDDRLDRDIDGISGATLSVRAVTDLVRFALALHRATPYGDAP